MKRLVLFAALFALVAGMSGCCASSVARVNGHQLVIVENEGCKMLFFIPLLSGDPDHPNQEVANWFDNTVTLETNMRLLDETLRREKAAGYRNLQTYYDDESIVPILFRRHRLVTSAEIVK